ncbi:MAG: hypothetical protein EOO04_01840 [Chitinophagaceae bacterium]|nr:MAG: hypothetical protein EOO04_01840 [Chitinophagaceae bacterium]
MSQLYMLLNVRKSWVLAFILLSIVIPSCKKEKAVKPCEPRLILGKLTLKCDGEYEFRTNGGGTILINLERTQIIVKHDDYEKFRIEFWGANLDGDKILINFNHENLNGKHIKDRLLATRTLIFPDGAKITMASAGMDKEVGTISIYDGKESHQFDLASKTVKHSSLDASKALQLDRDEADGETGTFSMDDQGLEFFNIYNEATPGNKVNNRLKLGTIIRNEPTRVNDFFDDPRLGHT